MEVWIVMDNDDDATWVVAVYPTQALAKWHVEQMGGYIEDCHILDSIHPDVIDPVKQQARAKEAELAKRRHLEIQEHQNAEAKWRAEARPEPPHMSLCHCEVFSEKKIGEGLVNAHGYCGYCGGFLPAVFREHMGEEALRREIDKLAIHDREKMRIKTLLTTA